MSDSKLSSYQKKKRAELFNAIETSRPVLAEDKLKMLDEFIEKNEAVVREVEKEKNIMADSPIKESELESQTISYTNPFTGEGHIERKSANVDSDQMLKKESATVVLPPKTQEIIDQRVESPKQEEHMIVENIEKEAVLVKEETIEEPILNNQLISEEVEKAELIEDEGVQILNNNNQETEVNSETEDLLIEANADELLKAQRKKLEEELPDLTESQKKLIVEQDKIKNKTAPNVLLEMFIKSFAIIWGEINRIDVVKKFMVEYNSNVALAKENAIENYSTFGRLDSIKLGMEMIVDKYLNTSEQAKSRAFIDKKVDEKYSLKLFKQGFVISVIFIAVLLLFGLYENITDNIIPITLLREVLFIIPFGMLAFVVYKFHERIYLKSLFPLTSMTAGIFGLVVAMIFIINSYVFVTVLSLILAVVLIYFGFTRLELDLKKLSKEFSMPDKDKQCPTCGKLVPKGESYCYNCEREVY